MANWRKTKCCGTCVLWDREHAKDAAGRVQNVPAKCNWALTVMLPESVLHLTPPALKPSWMCRDYGTKCECWTAYPLDQCGDAGRATK